jgi:hypothetical protein
MKKKAIYFILVLTLTVKLNISAQDSLKANYRNCLTELNVNLFQGQLSLNNALNQVKFRYMFAPGLALRIAVSGESKKTIHNTENIYGTNPSKNNIKGTSTMVGVNFGIEKHFRGTKRLSPYIGGELAIGYKWSKYVIETNTLTTTIDGAWQQYQYVQTSNGTYPYLTNDGERGFLSYGLNFVTGFDFYIAKHLFIGYELEFGFTNKKYSNIDVAYSSTTTTNNNNTNTPSPDYYDREFSLGPKIINGIRVGFVF